MGSATQPQTLYERPVAIGTCPPQVIQQSTALAHEIQQPATRVMVILVHFEVFRELLDPLREQRNLDLRGSGVRIMLAKRPNGLRLDCS